MSKNTVRNCRKYGPDAKLRGVMNTKSPRCRNSEAPTAMNSA